MDKIEWNVKKSKMNIQYNTLMNINLNLHHIEYAQLFLHKSITNLAIFSCILKSFFTALHENNIFHQSTFTLYHTTRNNEKHLHSAIPSPWVYKSITQHACPSILCTLDKWRQDMCLSSKGKQRGTEKCNILL